MNMQTSAPPLSSHISDREENAWKRAVWRILPILMISYIFAYLDRINVGIAKLQMSSDLAFSETVYGLGAGIFFIGFFFFQVPSNIVLQRFGARRLLAALLACWAVIAPLTALVTTPFQFYAVRFMLGLTESGFYPGVILYLSFWFPSYRRGKMFALFAAAVPLSGLLGGPISGWIMDHFHNMHGLAGWKWLFILQGTPSLLVGLLVLKMLPDRINDAKWLSAEEKAIMNARVQEDAVEDSPHEQASLGAVLRNGKLWLLTLIYFCLIAGFYTVSFWLPTLVRNAGVEDVFTVGMLTAIPYAAAIVTMIVASRSADKHRERRWHLVAPMIAGAIGLTLAAILGGNLVLSVLSLCLAAAGVLSASSLFWMLPTTLLGGVSAAAGIAGINSFANLAGFCSPYLIGWIIDTTKSTSLGVYTLAACLALGSLLALTVPKRLVNR